MTDERRYSRRYEFRFEELYVFTQNSLVSWAVKDISKEGLSFLYTPATDEELETDLIHIMMEKSNQPYLPNITCRMIYDIPVLAEGCCFRGGARRRRGVAFINLTATQSRNLECLLKKTQITISSEVLIGRRKPWENDILIKSERGR